MSKRSAYDNKRRLRGCPVHSLGSALSLAEKTATHVGAHAKAKSDPILIGAGKGSECKPFLRIQKDAEAFSACNVLANEIGELDTPKRAFKLIAAAIGDEINEVFGIVTLDIHLRMKSIAETGRGEQDAVAAPMVPTLQAALIDGAHAVILLHVHPSGVKALPSDADNKTTKAFEKAFELINIHLLDHIIVGGDKKTYYSYAEDGKL